MSSLLKPAPVSWAQISLNLFPKWKRLLRAKRKSEGRAAEDGFCGLQRKHMEDPVLDTEMMLKIAKTRMPFGKYKGRLLLDLPEPYVVWFSQKGFPEGELGRMLSIVYEVKLNGLEYLFKPLK